VNSQLNITGDKLFRRACDLFPINRSITGDGLRETLNYIKNIIPALEIYSIDSGSRVFDWIVPDEWRIRSGWISHKGVKVIDFEDNNLHVMGYSLPIDRNIELSELRKHLYSDPSQPEAIPYVTSYYKRDWGFCLADNVLKNLPDGEYHVYIDSELFSGQLNYGEIFLKGESDEEVFFSTYVCHPSMANNEVSGPVVLSAVAEWLSSIKHRRLSYRFVFVPETIGSIAYLSKNLDMMKERTIAGFNVTCVGDDNCYSYLPSRRHDTLADKVALAVLKGIDGGFKKYSFLDRGSDERQYCYPTIDLPVCSIMRSKYHEYKEYHTSLDDLNFISGNGLFGSYALYMKIIETLENNVVRKASTYCEPNLGSRGLYNKISWFEGTESINEMLTLRNVLAYSDGKNDLIDIANLLAKPLDEINRIYNILEKHCLVERI